MMKATELMIGDWVYSSRECFKGNIKISGIVSHSLSFPIRSIDAEDDSEIYYHEDEIEPIRLTPEILTKNDFAYNGLERGYIRLTALVYNELIGGDVVVKFQEGSAQVFIHAGFGLIGFIGTVSYVHELQHILRNFVEWEIDL